MISLVTPIYDEEAVIPELHRQVKRAMDRLGRDWEVVYVNDGSRDRSLELLLAEAEHDSRVVVVDLSRNWGHQPALTAGLSIARGDAVILMDGDLQDPPSVIPDLVAAWEAGAKVVVAERRTRAEIGPSRPAVPALLQAPRHALGLPDPAQRRHLRPPRPPGRRRDQPPVGEQPLPARPALVGRLQDGRRPLRPGGPRRGRAEADASASSSATRSTPSSASATNRCG